MELAKIIYNSFPKLSDKSKNNIYLALDSIKPRVELMTELSDIAKIYIIDDEIKIEDDAAQIIKGADAELIAKVAGVIEKIEEFSKDNIQIELTSLANEMDMKLGELMKIIRAFITGRVNSPSVFEVIEIIGKEQSLKRLYR